MATTKIGIQNICTVNTVNLSPKNQSWQLKLIRMTYCLGIICMYTYIAPDAAVIFIWACYSPSRTNCVTHRSRTTYPYWIISLSLLCLLIHMSISFYFSLGRIFGAAVYHPIDQPQNASKKYHKHRLYIVLCLYADTACCVKAIWMAKTKNCLRYL